MKIASMKKLNSHRSGLAHMNYMIQRLTLMNIS